MEFDVRFGLDLHQLCGTQCYGCPSCSSRPSASGANKKENINYRVNGVIGAIFCLSTAKHIFVANATTRIIAFSQTQDQIYKLGSTSPIYICPSRLLSLDSTFHQIVSLLTFIGPVVILLFI